MVELERPIKLVPGNLYKIKIFLDKTIGIVYINNEIAMSIRLYDLKEGKWGFFVQEGSVQFYKPAIWRSDNDWQ